MQEITRQHATSHMAACDALFRNKKIWPICVKNVKTPRKPHRQWQKTFNWPHHTGRWWSVVRRKWFANREKGPADAQKIEKSAKTAKKRRKSRDPNCKSLARWSRRMAAGRPVVTQSSLPRLCHNDLSQPETHSQCSVTDFRDCWGLSEIVGDCRRLPEIVEAPPMARKK